MHIRALVLSAFLLAAVAVAQDVPDVQCQAKVAEAAKSTPAATPEASGARPVAFVSAQDAQDQETELLDEITRALKTLELQIDLEELEGDLDFTKGAIAIMVGPDGKAQVLGEDAIEGLHVDLQDADVALGAIDLGSDEIDRLLAQLDRSAEDGGHERGYLGIQMNLDGGMNVTGVLPGSGAAKAGLQPGDRILEIAGQSTADEGIGGFLEGLEAGGKVKVVYARGDKKKRAKVRLMTLGAIQGEEDEEPAVESSPVEDVEFGGLRERVRGRVLRELGDAEGRISIVIAGEDGEQKIIETRDIDLGDLEGNATFGLSVIADDEEGVHVFRTDEGQSRRLRMRFGDPGDRDHNVEVREAPEGRRRRVLLDEVGEDHRTIEVHVDAEVDASGPGFLWVSDDEVVHDHDEGQGRGRIIIKRIRNGQETTEEYKLDGGHAELPEQVRRLLDGHGGDELHRHDAGPDAEHEVRRLRRVRPEGGGAVPPAPQRVRGHDADARSNSRHDGRDHEIARLEEHVRELEERIGRLERVIERLERLERRRR